ncbi:MAG: AAA family ATPase [Candidatus Paceibacterota bacterium]
MTLLTGVVLITGEHGVGKTRFALEAGNPERTLFIDDDQKGRSTVQRIIEDGIEFGKYIDFIGDKRLKPIERHEKGLEIIDSIEANKYDVLVWDTWTGFAETCANYVQTHNSLFRDSWAAMGKIKAGEEYKEARNYEAELIHRLQTKVPLVILISHLKNQYLNNAATGKEIPAVSKAVDSVCNLRLWLRRNPASSTPIALVLKNIEKNMMTDRGLRTIQLLPTKITPISTQENFERSLWDSIERYIANPIGNRKPTKDETPDDFEMSIVQGTLTQDQRLAWLYALKEQKQAEAEEQFLLAEENKAKAIELQSEGKSLTEIASILSMPLTEVVKCFSQGQ